MFWSVSAATSDRRIPQQNTAAVVTLVAALVAAVGWWDADRPTPPRPLTRVNGCFHSLYADSMQMHSHLDRRSFLGSLGLLFASPVFGPSEKLPPSRNPMHQSPTRLVLLGHKICANSSPQMLGVS
jgi:hypothetical protein